MKQGSEPIVGHATRRVMQGAAFCAKHTLENLPAQLAEPGRRANLPTELRPELLDGIDETRPRVLAVEARIGAGPRFPITSVEREEPDGPVAIEGRLECAGEHDAYARRPVDPAGHVPPSVRGHEHFERRRVSIGGKLPLSDLESSNSHARSSHSGGRVHDSREPETQTCTPAWNSERNDDAPCGLNAHRDNQSSASRRMFMPLVVSTDST